MRMLISLFILLICSTAYAQDTPYNYYLGPFVWDSEILGEGAWVPPNGTVGFIDFRNTSDQSQSVTSSGVGFFATTETLNSPYISVGSGFISEIVLSNSDRDNWQSETGYTPQGQTLLDAVWEQITDGSDPSGEISVLPLMPNTNGFLELRLSGHSLLRREKFLYGKHPHTLKVRDVLRNEYKKIRAEDIKNGSQNYRKVMDYWGEKYKVKNPENIFIPDDLPKERPLPHTTSITESFNTGDTATLGPDLTWTDTSGDSAVSSNQGVENGANGFSESRAEHDLSGVDHYSQAYFGASYSTTDDSQLRLLTRFSSSARTHYGFLWQYNTSSPVQMLLFKRVAGSLTRLGSGFFGGANPVIGDKIYCEINGSTLRGLANDVEQLSLTDTAITTGTRTGIAFQNNGYGDNYQAEDLAVGASKSQMIVTTI